MDTNLENLYVANLLGYRKHCATESCKIWRGPNTSWPFYHGLPNFREDIPAQLEIVSWLQHNRRMELVIRFFPGRVEILQGHYFVKGETFSDAIWKFVTWVLDHERNLLTDTKYYDNLLVKGVQNDSDNS